MREGGVRVTIALLGNPNSGKTTLFNRLTGMRHHVGNFPGVTVERAEGICKADSSVRVIDLPGMYSLSSASAEERIALEALLEEPPDAVVSVVDATSPARGLYLTLELLQTGLPVIIALTMMDEVEKSRGSVDMRALSDALFSPVISARDESPEALVRAAKKARPGRAPMRKPGPAADQDIIDRYARVDRLCAAAVKGPEESAAQMRSRKVDQIATHRFLAFPLFAATMGLLFFLTFGPPGQALQRAFLSLMSLFSAALDAALSRMAVSFWLRSLIVEGILAGLSTALSFLPTIAILFLLLSLLEDSGYMARMSFITDGPLRRVGLSGRSFVPLLVGFGCSVPAIMATRTLPSRRDRLLTILFVPFCSCSAKAPIYALLVGAFFPAHGLLVVVGLYVFGVLLGVLAMVVLRSLGISGDEQPFLLELPAYRIPSVRTCVSRVWARMRVFLRNAFTLLLLSSVAIWSLGRVTLSLTPAAHSGESMLAAFGKWISPVFLPLGFSDWRAATALLSGLMAKEGVVTTLGVLLGATGEAPLSALLHDVLSPLSALSFLTFTLLYMPCVSTFAAARRELGGARYALLAAFFHTGVAWVAACMVYNIGGLFLR